jgi:superfamily II DNA or RNA helicase
MRIEVPADWGIKDGKPFTPRDWQARCHAKLVTHYSQPNPTRGVVRAVTGAGKGPMIAQWVASLKRENDSEVIVVVVPSINLVKQLGRTLRERIDGDDFTMQSSVGQYYTFSKDLTNPIIVVCMDSLLEFSEKLIKIGRTCQMLIVDEVHKSECDSFKDAFSALMAKKVVGFTATPYRTDEKESLSLFDEVIFRYTVNEALKDKNVIVPWKIINYDGPEVDADTACYELIKDLPKPGVCNATSIADAEVFAQKLRDKGMKCEAIHSKLEQGDYDIRFNALSEGKLDVVVYVTMLCEGVDIPRLRWLALRRPTTSRTRFAQEIGRVLRWFFDPVTNQEKNEALIIDIYDLFGSFRLSYEEALGEIEEADGDLDDIKDPGKALERKLQTEVFDVMQEIVNAKASKAPWRVEPLATYLSTLVSAMDVEGLISRKIASKSWRANPVSAAQERAIVNMGWVPTGKKCVPKEHARAPSTSNSSTPYSFFSFSSAFNAAIFFSQHS